MFAPLTFVVHLYYNFSVGLFYHAVTRWLFNFFKLFTEGPDIWIEGTEEAVCGSTAHFQATVKERKVSYLSVNWHKSIKNETTPIEKSNKKFWGKTNKELFIESVCKEDEGEYHAELSIEEDRKGTTIKSNVISLHVVGGMILLIDINLKRISKIIIFC